MKTTKLRMYLPNQRQLHYYPHTSHGLVANPPANRVLSTCFRLRSAYVFARARESRLTKGADPASPRVNHKTKLPKGKMGGLVPLERGVETTVLGG